jgi:enoyl-CoA hydratase/3-hydroxyacyl-CoA dehydrogenase
MGHGIALVFLLAGFDNVFLHDLSEDALNKAKLQIKTGLEKSQEKGLIAQDVDVDTLLSTLKMEVNLNKSVERSDFIIEAAYEDLDVKRAIFSELEKHAKKDAILATNTSTFKISHISASSQVLNRLVGMHFFLPPITQNCIEVMKTDKTDPEVFIKCLKLAEILPSTKPKRYVAPIQRDSPGFIANRLLLTPYIYLNWLADKAYEEGIPFEQLDADAGNITPQGPFQLSDYLGLDTAYKSLLSFAASLSPDFLPGKVLSKLISEGHYGKKSGRGFLRWDDQGKPLITVKKKAGILNPEAIFAIQLNEGCRLLQERIVNDYKIIEKVMINGTGFPGPFRTGKRNHKKWSTLLRQIAGESGKRYLEPCEMMLDGSFIELKGS